MNTGAQKIHSAQPVFFSLAHRKWSGLIVMPNLTDRVAVLVVSCDKYSDLWKPFFSLFWRFWPDCPFDVYLLSNNIDPAIPQVKSLLVGDDISWSDSLQKGVRLLKEDYVLLFLDDLFLREPVKTKEVLEVFSWAVESDVNYVRMNPMRNKPDEFLNESIGILSKGVIYRTSTVVSVWKRNVLLDLLKDGESAWDFEAYGSIRSDKYDRFYARWKDCFPITNVVIKGKWRKGAVRRLKSLGIEIDLTSRRTITLSETIIQYLRILRSCVLDVFPAKYRRRVKNFMLRGKYDYEQNT